MMNNNWAISLVALLSSCAQWKLSNYFVLVLSRLNVITIIFNSSCHCLTRQICSLKSSSRKISCTLCCKHGWGLLSRERNLFDCNAEESSLYCFPSAFPFDFILFSHSNHLIFFQNAYTGFYLLCFLLRNICLATSYSFRTAILSLEIKRIHRIPEFQNKPRDLRKTQSHYTNPTNTQPHQYTNQSNQQSADPYSLHHTQQKGHQTTHNIQDIP
jgi:hypothetical protein